MSPPNGAGLILAMSITAIATMLALGFVVVPAVYGALLLMATALAFSDTDGGDPS